MIRPVTCLAFLLACGSGLYLYQAKHRVKVLDDQIAAMVKSTDALREQTRMLSAEWTLLNDPERLRKLANQFLTLQTVSPNQFTSSADLDSRLPAPLPQGAPPAQPLAASVVAEQSPGPGTQITATPANPAGTDSKVAAAPALTATAVPAATLADAGLPKAGPPAAKDMAAVASRGDAQAAKPGGDLAKVAGDSAAPRPGSDAAGTRLATDAAHVDDHRAGARSAPTPPHVAVATNHEPPAVRHSPDVHEVAQRTFVPRTAEARPVMAARLPRPIPTGGSFLGMAGGMAAPPAPMPMPQPMGRPGFIPYGGSGG